MPSSALAITSSRRATRASDFLLASLRSTTGDRSLRIHSAVILPSSNQSEGNHEPDPLGIAPRQQESSLSTPGMRRISPTKHRALPAIGTAAPAHRGQLRSPLARARSLPAVGLFRKKPTSLPCGQRPASHLAEEVEYGCPRCPGCF